MYSEELLSLAKRTIWFKEPKEALDDKIEFLNYLMNNGTLDDIFLAQKYYKAKDFKEALENAHPGIFDKKSWNFWHVVLGYNKTPALPKRPFITDEEWEQMPKWKDKS